MHDCVSHHYACDCREEKFRRIEEENAQLKKEIERLKQRRNQIDDESYEYAEKLQAAQKEVRWLVHLVDIMRDHGNLRYKDNTGVLAFSDLKDLARDTLR